VNQDKEVRERLVQGFRRHFSGEPRCFRAPGRVNLIGEHTDYNDGFVFPMALAFHTATAVLPRRDRRVNVWSENMGETFSFSLDDNDTKKEHWSDYIAGVARMLELDGLRLPGADLYVESTVPVGAGLSSSAAVEISSALAFLSTRAREMEGKELARLGQRAENRFVGMNCGIMDQFVSVHGERNHALFLDCRSLDYDLVPLPSERVCVVICNTMVKHELGASAYNERRAECEEGVRLLGKTHEGIRALRDVSPEHFQEGEEALPEDVRRRCRHVILENQRVLDSLEALKQNDPARFGRLMNASHDSLRDDYQVSCTELDVMVEIARRQPGCLGARMTGGGFGGCTVNLVETDSVDAFSADVSRAYQEETGIQPQVYVSTPGRGAHEMLP